MKNSIVSKLVVPFFVAGALAVSSGQAFARDVVHSGEFVGKSDHITTGKVSIEKVSNGYLVKPGSEFSLESQLIKELSQGVPSAFEFLIREYGGYLINVASRYLKNPADAQDVVQESYLQVFKNISKFRGESSLKSWLHRITINNALMKIRKDRNLKAVVSEDHIDDSDGFDENGKRLENTRDIGISADEVYSNDELRSTIQKHIMSLPADYRNILLLRDIEGYSTTETAELLEISPSLTKTRLHRAGNKLKKLLENGDY